MSSTYSKFDIAPTAEELVDFIPSQNDLVDSVPPAELDASYFEMPFFGRGLFEVFAPRVERPDFF